MYRIAAVIVFISVGIGLSFYYWRGMPFWSIPLMSMIFNLGVLYLIFPGLLKEADESRVKSLEKGQKIKSSFVKWLFWLGSTGYMFLQAGYYKSWDWAVLKFACMQQFVPSMKAHMELLNESLTVFCIDIAMALVMLNMVLMIVNFKCKDRTGEKLKAFLGFLKKRKIVAALLIVGMFVLAKPAIFLMNLLAIGSILVLLLTFNFFYQFCQ